MLKRASAVLLLAVAGCDGGPQEPAKTTKMKAGNPYVEQLRALNDMNRGLALRRAIQDSGEACKKVDSSGYQQDYKNLSMWTARCSDGRDWAVFIAPNADVQVRNCADVQQLGLPACRFEPS
ncbi:MAG TPA: hypothetical protein VGW34_05575 [Allosphingosinicella sp.]|nr:hypothetical protein [Allosphingosinicella sp.]